MAKQNSDYFTKTFEFAKCSSKTLAKGATSIIGGKVNNWQVARLLREGGRKTGAQGE